MTIEQYKERIDGVLANPDTALAEMADIYKELEADLTTLNSLKADHENLEKRVKDLQETNIKLYMSSGQKQPEEPEEPEVTEEETAVNDFFDNMFNKGE